MHTNGTEGQVTTDQFFIYVIINLGMHYSPLKR